MSAQQRWEVSDDCWTCTPLNRRSGVWELLGLFFSSCMYILSNISEGVALINSSLHPRPLKSELSTAVPIRVGYMGHEVLSRQARQPAVLCFEAHV